MRALWLCSLAKARVRLMCARARVCHSLPFFLFHQGASGILTGTSSGEALVWEEDTRKGSVLGLQRRLAKRLRLGNSALTVLQQIDETIVGGIGTG